MKPDANSFTEKIDDAFTLIGMLKNYHPIISNCNNEGRRDLFFEYLKNSKLKECQFDGGEYDYIIVQACQSPNVLYSILEEHNEKLIIFDNEILDHSKPYINILMGAVCNSPDSGDKWTVDYLDKKSFKFKGHIIILASYSGDELYKKKEKLNYVLRDMTII